LDSCRLYIITPSELGPLDQFADKLECVLAAGDVSCLQLRLKGCDDDTLETAINVLKPLCHERDVAFILNDRPDLAASGRCDGVHIGSEDASYKQARAVLPPDCVVGVTCNGSYHRAMEAAERGADYVAFGAFYDSVTKKLDKTISRKILLDWSTSTTVPCVAIGGITIDNCISLVSAGADFLAVCAGVWQHPAGPAQAVKEFNNIFKANKKTKS